MAELRRFDGVAVRELRAHPLRALLTTAGVALGTAMILGVLLLTGTIKSTFTDFFSSIYGRTDLVVTGRSAVGTLPEAALARTRKVDGVADAEGVVTGSVRWIKPNGRVDTGRTGRIQLTAADRVSSDLSGVRLTAGRQIAEGQELLLEEGWAQSKGIAPGERLSLATPAGRSTLTVTGLFRYPAGGNAIGGGANANVPLATGRALLGKPAGFDELRIAAATGVEPEVLKTRIKPVLPAGATVTTPRGRSDDAAKQLQTLDVALLFFAGTALFVGGYLILNAFNMTVLQRLRELGMLRTLGTSRRMILRAVLVEALVVGVLGTAVGLAAGFGIAAGLLSVFDSSFGLAGGSLKVTAGPIVIAAVAGLATSLLGALRPARRAARTAPMQAVLSGAAAQRRRPGAVRGVIALLLILPAIFFGGKFWFGGESSGWYQALGLGSMLGLFVGLALGAPLVVPRLVSLLARPLSRISPTAGRLAADATSGNPMRTAGTAATLLIGLSVVVVNGTMSASFVESVKKQMDKSNQYDVTIQPRDWNPVDPLTQQYIDPGLQQKVAALPAAAVVAPLRGLYLELPDVNPKGTPNGVMLGIDPVRQPRVSDAPVRGADRAEAYRRVAAGGALIDEAYARIAHLGVGDKLTLSGASGTRSLPVVGTIDSVAIGVPTVEMSLESMRAITGLAADSQLLVRARSPDQRGALESQVNRLLASEYPGMEALSTAQVKRDTDRQITQQFTFFNAIIGIAILISLLGMVNALAMSVIERRREIGVLRALGSSRWQVAGTMVDEGLLVTISGALVGIAAGLVIGWVWVHDARALFSGMEFHFPTGIVVVVFCASIVLGVLAALLPARRAARTNIIEAVNYE